MLCREKPLNHTLTKKIRWRRLGLEFLSVKLEDVAVAMAAATYRRFTTGTRTEAHFIYRIPIRHSNPYVKDYQQFACPLKALCVLISLVAVVKPFFLDFLHFVESGR